MSEIKSLLKSLLREIYGRTPGIFQSRIKKKKKKMHPKLYEKRLLQKLSPKVLKDICEILKFEIRLISKYLERVLISRDKNRTHRTILCGFLDILVSSRFGESSREMRFGLSSPPGAATQKGRGDGAISASSGRSTIPDETNSSSDFNQWLHAMKMVARLPGGMPPEFRRKLWLALADKYLKSKNVDWEKEEVKCFSEQWREDDEELGIQIVKDLHRTGSSLCSGPAGTINQAKLKRILLGYARFNPEVGYCQGFNMLGALILQVMDKEEIESIKVMIYLVEGILPSGYFSGSLGGLQADMAVFRELMTSKLPRLAKHLQKLQGPVENAFEPPLTNVFTMQWFLTMFCTCLPMTCVLRVWDLVLIEGSDVLLRTALVLWSLLEERILNARTADDFYCQMGSFSSELLNGHLVDSNGLIEKVVDLGPITDLQKLRDKHLYNITPFRDKKGLQLYYSDEDGDSDEDSRMAVATAWGLRLRRGSAGLGSKSEGKDRIALDISLLKKQYDRLRERQRQAHIILTSAVARQGSNPNQSSIQMNQLLIGRNAIVTNNGRRLGPPQGAIPPARKPSLPTSKPPKLAQTKKLLSGETLHWRDTDLSKRRRGSLKWKDIKSDSSQSGLEDRPAPLIESAPSSRSSSSEPKSKRASLKASRQRSDSSSYSEESDGNSSTSTSLCDDDEIADHNLSSLEGSPMRKQKSSKKHSEVSKQKSLEDVLNSNDGQPTIDNQIPFIQLTTIESPVLNANKTDIDPLEYGKEDSETESNRLDYAGFVDDFSWPDMNEPTSSVSLEDTTIDATSVEGDFLSLSNVITSTSQLSPIPDITTYINNSNISPLRTPISTFNYASLVVNMDDSKKFDVNEEGVTNEYFERVNIVERPTKLDLLYSLNEEDSIRNAYVSCEPSPESSKVVKNPKLVDPEINNTAVNQVLDEEQERKMKVLLEYSNKSSLSFIAEAKHEISSGMLKEVKEMEFDVDSLKYQPSTLVPLKKPYVSGLKTDTDNTIKHMATVPSLPSNTKTMASSNSETNEDSKTDNQAEKSLNIGYNILNSPKASSPPKNLAEELAETEFKTNAGEDTTLENNLHPEEIEDTKQQSYEDEVLVNVTNNIPSTEDLEQRFRALEMNFSDRKDSLKNKVKKDSPTSKEVFQTKPPCESPNFPENSIEQIDSLSLKVAGKEDSPTSKEVSQIEPPCEISKKSIEEMDSAMDRSSVMVFSKEHLTPQPESTETLKKDVEHSKEATTIDQLVEDEKNVQEFFDSHPSSENLESNLDQSIRSLQENQFPNEDMNLPKNKEKGVDLSFSSTKKELSQNIDKIVEGPNPVSHPYYKFEDERFTAKEDTGSLLKEELETLTQNKRTLYTADQEASDLSAEDLNPVSNTYHDQTELVEESYFNERKQSMFSNKEKSSLSLIKKSSKEDLNKNNPTDGNPDLISMEDELRTNNTDEVAHSSVVTENKEDLSLPNSNKDHLNDDWRPSDLHNQYKSQVEESNQLQISEDIKAFEKENERVSSSGEATLDNDCKSADRLSAEVAFKQKHEHSTLEKLVEEKRTTDDKEIHIFEKEDPALSSPIAESSNEVPKTINPKIIDEEDLVEKVRSTDENETSHLKEDTHFSLSNIKESKIEDSKSTDLDSKEKVGIAVKNETTSLEELSIPSPNKDPLKEKSKSDDDDKIHSAGLTTPPMELTSSYPQVTIEDSIVKNLSDDSKQSLLPKEVKKQLPSLTSKELSNEGVLYYEHHSANEYGSETDGLNDPKQTEDDVMQTQSTKNENSSSQEQTPLHVETNEERSIVQSSTTDNSVNKDLQKVNEKEHKLATIKTVEKPLSTYSFSYTQDRFKDHVSFLSEVQSSVSPKSSTAIQDTSASQSTFDLKHSLDNLVAVTTSVSVRNSASVKSSVSIKSSVSLKSSSLYDRERSLNVNTGITVSEEPKFDDSKMILSNQLEISEGNKRLKEENLRLNQNILADNQNNGVTVSVMESGYKAIHSANTSNISVCMQIPNQSLDSLGRKHSTTGAILEHEALQIVEESTSANINIEEASKDKLKNDVIESPKNQAEVKADESQKRKSSYSQDIDERLKALEKRFSDRALPISTDTKASLDQSANEVKEQKKEQILTLDDVQPMKLKQDASSPKKSSPETEVISKEETDKFVPSTADLEHRFRVLERKLSAKNIRMPAKNEEQKHEASNASKQSTSTSNPSIVLSKNEDTSSEKEYDDSSTREKVSQINEDQHSTTRRRIPSTEDLETRFEALEIQKSVKSPTNLLSPSKIKEDFLVATNELDSNRKPEIPSTEDLEHRFQAFEESKKGCLISTTKNKDLEQTKVCSKNKEIEISTENNSTESQELTKSSINESEKKDLRFKTKEIPKVTFADTSDIKISSKKSSERTTTVEELHTKTKESPVACEFDRERILRKVPSAQDLEARFEALEKRKSFTGFSTKIQEHLLAEQNRNYLSSDSLNSIDSLKRRDINDKKVASTEDLVLRLDALEQRMAITENSIKNKISTETSHLSQAKKKFSPKLDFECKFEALDNVKPFCTETCTKENTSSNKITASKEKCPTFENQPNSLALLTKDAIQENKLILIKRSLFEDKEPEPKWLPSTEDLENRFDALEKQKTKSLNSKKKTVSEKEESKPKSISYAPQTKSTQKWETRFDVLEHRTPTAISHSKIIPTWGEETQSKFPSTKDLESRFEALEQQKSVIDRTSKLKDFQKRLSNEKDIKPTPFFAKPMQQNIEKPAKALSSRSIDQVLEQISIKTEEIEREHQMVSKLPSTQDLEIRYHELQLNTKRGEDTDNENVKNLEQTTDSIELTGNHKRRDLYKLESQSDETLTVSDPTGTEFETKSESRPTSCPEYRDPFDSNIVTTDRVLKIIEENSKILHRILKKTLADSGGNGNSAESMNSRSGFTDSLLALGNIFPRNDESISPSRIKSQSRVRSTITFRSEDSSITDRLASIKSTIKSIDTLCEDQSSRKDKCQRYIDSLFTARPSNSISPTPPIARPLIKVDEFESSSRPHTQERVAMRELKKETSPRRRRDEDREEYESRVRRDMMPNNVDAPSEFSCSLENIAKVDSEVDRINQNKQVETQLERPLSPYYAPGYDLNNRSITPVVYIPTKLEIRHTTVTSTFYDRYLTEKHIERTFPRSKKHSPVSPTITKSHLDISNYGSPNLEDRSSKSAENSPSRRKDGLSPNQTVSAAAYRRSFISSLEVAQKDLHIRSCDNILLQLRSSTHNNDVVPSIMVYNPLPTKIRKSPELGISLGLYKDYGSDASSKS